MNGRRRYRIAAFGTHWDSPSLMGALIMLASLRLDYGPTVRVTLRSFWEVR